MCGFDVDGCLVRLRMFGQLGDGVAFGCLVVWVGVVASGGLLVVVCRWIVVGL